MNARGGTFLVTTSRLGKSETWKMDSQMIKQDLGSLSTISH